MVEHYLKRIFALFHRSPNKATFEEYLNYLEEYDDNLVMKLFYYVRDNHTAMPSVAQLKKNLNTLKSRQTFNAARQEHEDCYFCVGVGLVPYLLSPKSDARITRYTQTMQRCKCSAGQEHDQRIPLHQKPQFEIEGDLSYPILVQVKMNKFNRKLNAVTAKAQSGAI